MEFHSGSGMRFFGAGPGSTSHRSVHDGGSDYGDVTPDDEAMERSRVQLVSSRRKPSQEADDLEIDVYRSSYASNASSNHHFQYPYSNNSTASNVSSHFPLLSSNSSTTASLKKTALTSASSGASSAYMEASTPDFKHPNSSNGKKKKKTKTPYVDEQDHRRSLPALDPRLSAGKASQPASSTRRDPTARRGSAESSVYSQRTATNNYAQDEHMYFGPGSPAMSSTKSCTSSSLFMTHLQE